ncbi:hypothetical protein MIC97_13715 [Aquamicrobium sp. NLF2-7]|uniref:hypothetical protein n=1 Tax=Aquamicrobium sp. NLF2-7 TaxID=2918753 RepID=UPI001EFBA7B2|nr:hypothetical protein [Aquamicrobium sp. NLF2-7]MCG8272557.1 hypothetical protein [Aquamicrobium sp. NLF2-7]
MNAIKPHIVHDRLNDATRILDCAYMAVGDVDDPEQVAAIQTVMDIAITNIKILMDEIHASNNLGKIIVQEAE